MRKKGRIFYGWWIVLAGFLLSGVSVGININCNTALMEPVCRSLGISISAFSLSSSITSFAAIPCYLLVPKLMLRVSMRKYMAVSGIGFVLFKLLFGLSGEAWQLYVCALGTGICVSGLSYMAVNSLLNNWFYEKNGTAVGIASAGGGILGALILPVITRIVSGWGWRAGYFAEALLGGILTVLAVAIVRDTPEETGERPYGQEMQVDNWNGKAEHREGVLLRAAKRQPSFYFLLFGLFLLSIAGMGIQPYLMSYLGKSGYSTGFAAAVVSLILVIVTFGKVGMGAVFDQVGLRAANGLACGSMILALLLLGFAERGAWVVLLFAVVFGFAYADMSIPAPYLTRKLFGKQDFTAIYGIIMVGTSVGGTIGNLLTGVIYEQIGSYQIVWLLYIGIVAVVAVLLDLAISLNMRNK